MPTISEALAMALQHHQAGRLQAAEQIYRQILAIEPNHVDALHLLGVLAYQEGKHELAIEYIGRAIGLEGAEASFHSNLGNVFQALGKLPEAVACHRRALELKPDYAGAHNNLGHVFQAQGMLDEAVACHRRALELKPDLANAHHSLGTALKEQGKLPEAVACYRRALELKPDYAEAHNNLGNVLKKQGKPDRAVACYCRALELKPDYAEAHHNLGNTFQAQGKLDEAVACYRRALESKPDYTGAHTNLGNVFQAQGKLDEAVACYRRALGLKPDYAEAHSNLGNAFRAQGMLEEAVACHRRALELKPDYAAAHSNLGNAFEARGMLEEAVACYRRALELKPDYAAAHSNLLFTLQFHAGATLAGLAQAHAEYDRQHAAPLQAARGPYENVRDPHRPLRLGFVSPDFRRHPVGFFLIQALENLDRGQCEVVCYSGGAIQDDLTMRFRAAATTWRDVAGLTDEELAEQIVVDRIDILFDLAGHTSGSRLLAFARKPAPIQVTWIGYEGTTGLRAIDYILADRYTIPPGQEAGYRERVLRMPDGYVCYDPPATSPEVGPLPAAQAGYVRFGSFNKLAKITPHVVGVWAKILGRVPQARLLLKYRGLDDSSVRGRYLDLFTAHGVDPGRLEFAPPSTHAEYLAAYRQVDIALDPFPFGGGATTCDALWMGVPVVTCPGETFASRHSLSHLTNAGLTETVARDLNEYVELAASLAGDWPRLAALRDSLRQRMAASPLCDGKRFGANLMALLREIWQQWIVSP
jgi:predicted O-linked N-acetylglucosamine transferase (SPINDLY family)